MRETGGMLKVLGLELEQGMGDTLRTRRPQAGHTIVDVGR